MDEDEVDELDDDTSDMLYLKYCFEGAASVQELAGWLRALARDLERRADEGWRLDTPVSSGWAHLCRD